MAATHHATQRMKSTFGDTKMGFVLVLLVLLLLVGLPVESGCGAASASRRHHRR
jgi:hypothetical protein